MKRSIALICLLLAPTSASARGWVCTEMLGLIQKYRQEPGKLVAEGDAATIEFSKIGFPPREWRIIVDNAIGLVAVQADASNATPPNPSTEVYLNALMIDKAGGGYRHLQNTVHHDPNENFSGQCTRY